MSGLAQYPRLCGTISYKKFLTGDANTFAATTFNFSSDIALSPIHNQVARSFSIAHSPLLTIC
jgi:hypothetical protein